MDKQSCNIVQDLLPLYIDEACSEESREMVEAHLKECEACREVFEQMKENLKFPAEYADAKRGLEKIRKVLRKKYVILALVVAAVTGGCMAGSWILQTIEEPIAYEDLKMSVVRDKKDPTLYNLTFNGESYACLYSESITLKEDKNCIYEAEIVHCSRSLWTQIFERKPLKNAVMWSFSENPDATVGYVTDEKGNRKVIKTVAAYYQATPGSPRYLLWEAEWYNKRYGKSSSKNLTNQKASPIIEE